MVDVKAEARAFADELGKRAHMEQVVMHHHARTADKIGARIAELEAENARLQNEWDSCDEMLQANRVSLAEAPSRPVAVKVKQLEWDAKSEWHHCADTIFGLAEIKHYIGDEGVWHRYAPFGTGNNKHPTAEDAKAAAQADYERCILSALEPAAPEERQEAAIGETPSERQRRLCDHSVSRANGERFCVTCGLPTRPAEQAVTEAGIKAGR